MLYSHAYLVRIGSKLLTLFQRNLQACIARMAMHAKYNAKMLKLLYKYDIML
jgi:hypothetical protein